MTVEELVALLPKQNRAQSDFELRMVVSDSLSSECRLVNFGPEGKTIINIGGKSIIIEIVVVPK